MYYPSLERIRSRLIVDHGPVDNETAEKIRSAMETVTEFSEARVIDDAMDTINGLLEGHGVEGIFNEPDNITPSVLYVNMGDPYVQTVCWVNGHFRVAAWGDLPRRFIG